MAAQFYTLDEVAERLHLGAPGLYRRLLADERGLGRLRHTYRIVGKGKRLWSEQGIEALAEALDGQSCKSSSGTGIGTLPAPSRLEDEAVAFGKVLGSPPRAPAKRRKSSPPSSSATRSTDSSTATRRGPRGFTPQLLTSSDAGAASKTPSDRS